MTDNMRRQALADDASRKVADAGYYLRRAVDEDASARVMYDLRAARNLIMDVVRLIDAEMDATCGKDGA
jgi:hypothetical protein